VGLRDKISEREAIKMYLTIIDTSGIQEYIFSTNKLKQIVGASHLVNCAQRDWVQDCLNDLHLKHNIVDINAHEEDKWLSNARIEDEKIDAELVYSGGGNTLLLFNTKENAILFTKKLTRRVLEDAPGLRLVISHYLFDWQVSALGGEDGILHKAFIELAKRKFLSLPFSDEPGMGVTVQCSYSDLPAVNEINDIAMSSTITAKVEAEQMGHRRLQTSLNLGKYSDFPKELDQLGGTQGEKNLLAVVHIDGNAMGDRVSERQKLFPNAAQNRACLEELRKFSFSIQRAAILALQETIDFLISKIDAESKIAGEIKICENKLPFRPIVFGGDDLTFVCDGRIGLSLASYYLQQAAKKLLTDGRPLYCRAGVAIVNTHFPFSRAYALAEELCSSAKDRIREMRSEAKKMEIDDSIVETAGMSAIDWHYAVGGFLGNLSDIRSREYLTTIGYLNMRPLLINNPFQSIIGLPSNWRTWDTFLSVANEFKNGTTWVEKHNKVKALRQVLRGSKEEVKEFCTVYGAELPKIGGEEFDSGWVGNHCVYYDAIEAIDSFIQL